MNRFMEMSDAELVEALENTINSIEASGGTGDWYDAVVEARRRLLSRPAVQTFYVVKRDEEPRYWRYRLNWSNRIELGLLRDYPTDEMMAFVRQNNPTARIVKVRVEEVGE